MLFYSGWIVIQHENDDYTDVDFKTILRSIEEWVKPFKQYNHICEIKELSWSTIFHISSEFNHDNGYHTDIINLYKKIGEIASGSYGILYLRDIDDPELFNEFQIYRLAKGVITKHLDTLLSPCDPTIENEIK